MNIVQRLISAGFATAALASAAVPALAWTVWPDVDFEWYADVGRQATETMPPPRAGYIWAPGHLERRGSAQAWVAGHWVRDEWADQVAASSGPRFAESADVQPRVVQPVPVQPAPDQYSNLLRR